MRLVVIVLVPARRICDATLLRNDLGKGHAQRLGNLEN